MLWMCPSDVLLHRPISLLLQIDSRLAYGRVTEDPTMAHADTHARNGTYSQTSFSTVGAIVILQRANHLVVGVRGGESWFERGRRHGRGWDRQAGQQEQVVQGWAGYSAATRIGE